MLEKLARAPIRLQTIFILFCGLLITGPASKAFSYDTRIFIGSRLISEDYRSIGSFSWDYASIRALNAFRSVIDVNASSDMEGAGSLDAFASIEASHSNGSFVPALRFESTANYHEIDGTYTDIESLILNVSLPLNLNGLSFSFFLRPFFGAGFFDDKGWNVGSDFGASFLAGDFVVTPGASLGVAYFPDDSRNFELKPSVGLAWYPGLPITGNFSFGWTRTTYSNEEILDSYPLSVELAILPYSWLYVSSSYTAMLADSNLISYRIDAGIELTRFRSSGFDLHLPLHYYYSWSESTGVAFGLSVMFGISFGTE